MEMDYYSLINLTEELYSKFMLLFLKNDGKFRSIKLDNFIFNESFDKIATKDLRVMIHTDGSIPMDVMMNMATVSLFMIANKIEWVIGYDYLTNLMKKYNCNCLQYAAEGFLQIKIGKPDEFKFKSSINVKKETSL